MFSLFKKFITPVKTVNDTGPTMIDHTKMSYEERKTWRLAMMQKSIKEVFSSLEIVSGMYKYLALPVDDRGHYYAIIIETTRYFSLSKHLTNKKLIAIETELKTKTFDNYGIVVDGVYWKANETLDVFENRTTAKLPVKSKKTIAEMQASFADTQPIIYDDEIATEIEDRYDPLTEDEANAFKQALATGIKTIPLKVNGKDYDTDLTPFS